MLLEDAINIVEECFQDLVFDLGDEEKEAFDMVIAAAWKDV